MIVEGAIGVKACINNSKRDIENRSYIIFSLFKSASS